MRLYGGRMRLSDTVASALLDPPPGRRRCGRGPPGARHGRGCRSGRARGGVGPRWRSNASTRLTPGFWVGWCSFELGHAWNGSSRGAVDPRPGPCPMSCSRRFDALAMVDPDGHITVGGTGPGRTMLEAAAAAISATEHTRRPRRLPASPTAGERAASSSLEHDAFCEECADSPRAPRRGRVLPGEPHPSAPVRAALDPVALTARSRSASLAARSPCSASPSRASRWQSCRRHRSATCRLRADRRVETSPDQGHRRRAGCATRQREGPRRERDDRRPRPQRPRARVHAGHDVGALVVRGGIAPRPLPPGEQGTGTLRPEVGVRALVAATFPPASVTGAPKPRVLQVIEGLEPVRRGVTAARSVGSTRAGDAAR